LGQVVAMADPDLGVWQYRRDNAGRLQEQIDAKGQRVIFHYDDPLGRLKVKEVYSSSGAIAYAVTNFYDSSDDGGFTVYAGQLFKVVDREGTEKYSYDVRGRTLKTARTLTKDGQTYTNQFTFDDADRVRTTAYPNNGPTVTNIYDAGGNLAQVKQAGGSNTVFYAARGFNAQGQLLGLTFGNGVVTTNDYYANSKRPKGVATAKPGSANLQNLGYTYDKVSNLKGIADFAYTTNASAALTNLVYDDLHRLTSLTRPAISETKTFSFSSIGNLTVNGEAGAGTYNYGTRIPHVVKSANGINYAYDGNGNMLVRGSQRLDYDPENRLTLVISTNSTTTYGYADSGARLWKQSSGTNGLQIWIGENYEEKNGQILFHVLAGGRMVCTFDSTGTNVFEYYHSDHLRSTSVLTDKNGNRIQHHEYSAFGRDRFTESATAFSLSRRYTSQVLDEDTGLYFYNARYYDPELARFIQADSIIPSLSNPQHLNRYSYTLNNPLKHTDPDGHEENNVVETATAPEGVNLRPPPRQAVQPITQVHPSVGTSKPPPALPPTAILRATPRDPATYSGLLVGAPHLMGPQGEIQARMAAEAILTGPAFELGGMYLGQLRNFKAVSAAKTGTRALVPMSENLFANGTSRTVAGYHVYGNAGLVGETYNVNVLGLYAQEGSQGLRALSTAFRAEAQAAGATRISISGNTIINPGISGLSPAAAQRFGFQLQNVNNQTIILTAPIP